MKQFIGFSIVAGALLLVPAAALQAQQGPMPLAHMEEVARVDYVDFATSTIVLDGTRYAFAPDVRWHGLEPETSVYSHRFSLPGSQVSFSLGQVDGQPVITDLFVLPKE